MSPKQLQDLIPSLLEITRRAGEEILKVYRTDFEVQYKDDKSPVTEADMAAHHLIVDALQELTPDIPVLSEESTGIAWAKRKHWQRYWLVDPLDGTREFLNRSGEFTVNIALIDNHRPVFGVVGVPVSGDIYWGGALTGAWHSSADGDLEQLHVVEPHSPLRVLASRNHLNPDTKAFISALRDTWGPIALVQAGSSLKICRIAEGRADLYPRLGPTSEWDTAAAHAVLLGAGGRVICLKGEPLLYNRKQNLLNPSFVASGLQSPPLAG